MTIVPGVYQKGDRGFIDPGSDLHNGLISPSKVAAITTFPDETGTLRTLSRWESPYRLWHRMKGITPPEPDRDDFRAGHAFEGTLAWFWRDENPDWRLSRGEVQFVGEASRFGFPYVVTLDRRACRGRYRKVVEFKTCRGWEEWSDVSDGAPDDYLIQVTAQMLLTGLTKLPADLVVLNKIGCAHRTYPIPFDEAVADLIIEDCRSFWASLDSDVPPPLDDSVASYECVREQHPEIDRGSEVEVGADLAQEYHAALAAEQKAETRARFAKTQVLDLMKRANYAVCGDQRVARRQPGTRGSVALHPIRNSRQSDNGQDGDMA